MYGEIFIPAYFPGYKEALRNPDKFTNKQIYFGGKILKINDSNFILKTENKKLTVQGNIPHNSIGANISGKAVFLKNHDLILKSYHISNTRIYKIWLSLIPLLIVLYLFINKYKLEYKTMQFKSKL